MYFKRLFCCIYFISIGSFANEVNFVQKETWGDTQYGMMISENDKLFVASDGILVLDMSTPSSPQKIIKIPIDTSELIRTFQKHGNTLYVLTESKFLIIDITSISEPAIISTINYESNTSSFENFIDFDVKNNQLFLLGHDSPHLRYYDISDINNPVPTRTISIPEKDSYISPRNVAITEKYLFVGSIESIALFSLENSNLLDLLYNEDTNIYSRASERGNVAVLNDTVYFHNGNDINIYDFSNITNIVRNNINIQGYLWDMQIRDLKLYTKDGKLSVYSLDTPTEPEKIIESRYEDYNSFHHFSIADNLIILNSNDDIVVTQSETEIGRYGNSGNTHLTISGNNLVTGGTSRRLFDLENGIFDKRYEEFQSRKSSINTDIQFSSGYLFGSNSSIYEIDAEHQLQEVGAFSSGFGTLNRYQVIGDKLLRVVNYTFEVYDLSIPLAPQKIFSTEIYSHTPDFWVYTTIKDNHIYASTTNGLYHISFNGSGEVVNSEFMTEGTFSGGVFIDGSYLYQQHTSATNADDLNVWDITNPTQPILKTTVKEYNGNAIYGKILKYKNWLILQGYKESTVLDISNPDDTFEIERSQIKPSLDPLREHIIHNNDMILSNYGQLIRMEINESPEVVTNTLSTTEDTLLTESLSVTNLEDDALEYFVLEQATHGVVEINENGQISYSPMSNYSGEDSFKVQVFDEYGGDSEKQIKVQIEPVNDAPIAENLAMSVQTTAQLSGQVEASDVEGDAIEFKVVDDVTNGELIFDIDGNFTYQSSNGYVGNDSFTYTATDASKDFSQATVNITVTAIPAPIESKETSSSGGSFGNVFMLFLLALSFIRLKKKEI